VPEDGGQADVKSYHKNEKLLSTVPLLQRTQ